MTRPSMETELDVSPHIQIVVTRLVPMPRFHARRNQQHVNLQSPQTSSENEEHPASSGQNLPTVVLSSEQDFAAIRRRIGATQASKFKEEAQKLADRVEELQQGLRETKMSNSKLRGAIRELQAQCEELRGRRGGAEK